MTWPSNHTSDRPPAGRLLLGIDGGGTHTVALLARDEGPAAASAAILGRGAGGPANYQAVGRDQMEQSLDEAISRAFDSAGLDRRPVAAICLGLAGADRPDDRRILSEWCERKQVAERVTIVNDGRLVLAAGTPGDWGLGIIAGTGSFALARSPDGQIRRAGGWGYLFGDEGSGYAIALDGLRIVSRGYDGSGPKPAFTEPLLSRLNIDDVKLLVPALYRGGLTRPQIAQLAEVVTSAAAAGDDMAVACLDRAAGELAATARAAASLILGLDRAIPLALAGGLLHQSQLYANLLVTRLREAVRARIDPVTIVTEPAVGGVRLAQTT